MCARVAPLAPDRDGWTLGRVRALDRSVAGGHPRRVGPASVQPVEQRIESYDPAVDPEQLLAHPLNARRHPGAQRIALRESLDRVGWVDAVKVNTRTGHLVDGHARVEEAITAGATVPVLYLDLSDEEERLVLATLDPIGALATYDSEVLTELLDGINIESSELAQWLSDQAALGQTFDPWNPTQHDDSEDHPDGDPALWPTVAVQCPPRVFTAWNERVGDGDAAELLAELLGL